MIKQNNNINNNYISKNLNKKIIKFINIFIKLSNKIFIWIYILILIYLWLNHKIYKFKILIFNKYKYIVYFIFNLLLFKICQKSDLN
nr:hypothetical protein [Haemoproteus tartakovskyi]